MSKTQSARSPQLTLMDKAARTLAATFRKSFEELERAQMRTQGSAELLPPILEALTEKLGTLFHASAPVYIDQPGASPEEMAAEEACWLIAPLTGQENFAHANEATGLAAAHVKNGEPVAGMMYFPLSDTFFVVEKGGPATGGGRRLRVSGRGKAGAERLLVQLVGDTLAAPAFMEACVGAFGAEHCDFRVSGCPFYALSQVAAGRADLMVGELTTPLEAALTELFLTESGGTARIFQTEEGGLFLIGGNPALVEKLQTSLSE